jgi:hypothetical protein
VRMLSSTSAALEPGAPPSARLARPLMLTGERGEPGGQGVSKIAARQQQLTGAREGGEFLLREHLHAGALKEHDDEDDGGDGEDNQGELPRVPASGQDAKRVNARSARAGGEGNLYCLPEADHEADDDLNGGDEPPDQVGSDH